jgi:DNA-directed RNA polymerase subunit K/omega
MEFETTILASKRAKTIQALDRAATVTAKEKYEY